MKFPLEACTLSRKNMKTQAGFLGLSTSGARGKPAKAFSAAGGFQFQASDVELHRPAQLCQLTRATLPIVSIVASFSRDTL